MYFTSRVGEDHAIRIYAMSYHDILMFLRIIYSIFSMQNLLLTVRAICLSILSMLSSCTKKERPPDDDVYNKVNPKKTRFVYHDDSV